MHIPEVLTVEKIDSIASLAYPVMRNVFITQSYSERSAVFAERMRSGANWCTYATWASKQAGQTIRHEDLQRVLENLLKNEPEIEAALSLVAILARQSGAQQSFEQLRDSVIGSMVAQAASHAADAVSRGNKMVFEEIAREFCHFITICLSDAAYDKPHIDSFCRQLKAGLPPQGQEWLAKGFGCYYRALFEQDLWEKTQLNLLANLLIGFHEQYRLQPEIAEALNASVDANQVKSDLLNKLFSGANWWIRLRLFFKRLFGSSLLDKGIEAFVQLIQDRLRRVLTAHLMTITLPPDNCLQLGRDLPVTFPAGLIELNNADLVALLAQVDPTPNSVLESGATDWANLSERMHYIADMFRCYHHSADLFNAAVTAAQIEAMKNGRLPAGKL
jgi:hypothetical protein